MQRFGPAGIALGAAIAAYLNSILNFAALSRRLGRILDPDDRKWIGVSTLALPPAVVAALITLARLDGTLQLQAVAGLGAFGLAYGGVTLLLKHPEAVRLARRRGRREPHD
jgi:peptidoglycan biosynthesis protein MviN/MurJ (putative lipid II flippase)